jgi:nitroreductase / dihydropteridine reductase
MTFLENLNWRYATKKFNQKTVSDLDLQKIKDAIRLTPTSFGVQPFHVHIVSDKKVLEQLKKYSKNNESKLETCSHLLVFSSLENVAKRFLELQILQKRTDNFLKKMGWQLQYFGWLASYFLYGRYVSATVWARNQTYIPLGFTLAACAELKIDSCPMEGFNTSGYKKILNLDKNLTPIVIIAIGYRDETDTSLVFAKTRFPEDNLFTNV